MARQKFEVTVPTEWKDITIAEFQRYLQIAKSTRRTRDGEIISLFCKVDKNLVKKLNRCKTKLAFVIMCDQKDYKKYLKDTDVYYNIHPQELNKLNSTLEILDKNNVNYDLALERFFEDSEDIQYDWIHETNYLNI